MESLSMNITFKTTKEQYDWLAQKANDSDMHLAEYMRQLIYDHSGIEALKPSSLRERMVMELLEDAGGTGMTVEEIMDETGEDKQNIWNALRRLRSEGSVVVNALRGRRSFVFALSSYGPEILQG